MEQQLLVLVHQLQHTLMSAQKDRKCICLAHINAEDTKVGDWPLQAENEHL